MGAKIEVHGARELARAMRKAVDREMPKQLGQAYKAAAKVVADKARSEAPAMTGALKGSIKPQGTKKSGKVKVGTAKGVPYAGPIHWGWRKRNIKPNPFVTRALGSTSHEVRRVFEKNINDLTKKLST